MRLIYNFKYDIGDVIYVGKYNRIIKITGYDVSIASLSENGVPYTSAQYSYGYKDIMNDNSNSIINSEEKYIISDNTWKLDEKKLLEQIPYYHNMLLDYEEARRKHYHDMDNKDLKEDCDLYKNRCHEAIEKIANLTRIKE